VNDSERRGLAYPARSASIGFTFAAWYAGQSPNAMPAPQATASPRAALSHVIDVGHPAVRLTMTAMP
jgi:hypothetical protein